MEFEMIMLRELSWTQIIPLVSYVWKLQKVVVGDHRSKSGNSRKLVEKYGKEGW